MLRRTMLLAAAALAALGAGPLAAEEAKELNFGIIST
jgi:hypothetical protein